MATAFRATTKGYRAELSSHERRLLSSLCADVIQLLEERGTEVSADADSGADPERDSVASESEAPAGRGAGLMDDSLFEHFSAELSGLGEEDELHAPEDPVVRRLLPDASEDGDEAAQFRRLAESSLRESKIADLRAARLMLENSTVQVSEENAPVLGRALNDLRLTLATRLGIENESDAENVHRQAVSGRVKDTATFMAEIYTFVTWLQESLFAAMLEYLPDEPPGEGPDGDGDHGRGPDSGEPA